MSEKETLSQLVTRLKGLEKEATPGEWYRPDNGAMDLWDGGDYIFDPQGSRRRGGKNLTFIAALRNTAPRLIEAAELLAEISASGVEQETRGYVTVQIDRETWRKAREI